MVEPTSFEFISLYDFVAKLWPRRLRYAAAPYEPPRDNERVLSREEILVDVELEVDTKLRNTNHIMIYLNMNEAIRVAAQKALEAHGCVQISDINKADVRLWFEQKISRWTSKDDAETADILGRERYYRDNRITKIESDTE